MAFASSSEYPIADGCFWEKSGGNIFEFDMRSDNPEFPSRVWVADEDDIIPGLESGWRYAKVKKTVAYLIVDEDEYGKPVVEKWAIKDKRDYSPWEIQLKLKINKLIQSEQK